MFTSIDIVIPSYRVQAEFLIPLINLKRPEDVIVKFFIVIDNPKVLLAPELIAACEANDVRLIRNEKNLGASLTRNKGIESGTAEWILFLDDDITVEPDLIIKYVNAVKAFPDEIGFIGLVSLPEPTTAFTKAINASGSAGVFSVANQKEYFSWGATANIMLKRSAMGQVRFSEAFPKEGGGEDVDFFLKIRQLNGYKDFKTLKEAEVRHPWWNEGKVNLKRAYRYGQGTGILILKNPEYARYDFLTTSETIFLTVITCLVWAFINPAGVVWPLSFLAGIIIIEIVANLVNMFRKPYSSITLPTLLYVMLSKTFYDFGVLRTTLLAGKLNGFSKRFNDNGSLLKQHFTRFNRYKITKAILYLVLLVYIASRF
jgi:GT2 family glycosyltransferase